MFVLGKRMSIRIRDVSRERKETETRGPNCQGEISEAKRRGRKESGDPKTDQSKDQQMSFL